jgi:hypothetical protein
MTSIQQIRSAGPPGITFSLAGTCTHRTGRHSSILAFPWAGVEILETFAVILKFKMINPSVARSHQKPAAWLPFAILEIAIYPHDRARPVNLEVPNSQRPVVACGSQPGAVGGDRD